jgi:hypothetical protein
MGTQKAHGKMSCIFAGHCLQETESGDFPLGSIYISFSGAYQSNFYWEHCYILVMALFFTENNTTEYFVMTVIEILTLEDLQHS